LCGVKGFEDVLACLPQPGIFYENAVNKILHDIVAAIQPEWCVIRGEFTPRGGLNTTVEARWPRRKGKARK